MGWYNGMWEADSRNTVSTRLSSAVSGLSFKITVSSYRTQVLTIDVEIPKLQLLKHR